MNSYDFFIYEFICFMNSYMNSGVPRFQMALTDAAPLLPGSDSASESVTSQRLTGTYRLMSPKHLRAPMLILTFTTKTLARSPLDLKNTSLPPVLFFNVFIVTH